MLRFIAPIAAVIMAVTLLLAALPASAEPYLAGFLGAALTETQDLRVKLGVDVLGPIADGKIKNVDFNNALLFGGKVGYFFDGFLAGGLGIEAEAYHFSPSIDDQLVTFKGTVFGVPTTTQTTLHGDLEVTGLGLNVLYRFQLAKDPTFQHGRVQPYLGVGIAAAIARLELQNFVLDGRPSTQDTAVQPAVHALGGVKIFLTEHIALFTEYKFMHTGEFEFDLKRTGTLGGNTASESSTVRTHLTSQNFYAGIAFHW
jgi:opacity protein-like surface antigen